MDEAQITNLIKTIGTFEFEVSMIEDDGLPVQMHVALAFLSASRIYLAQARDGLMKEKKG